MRHIELTLWGTLIALSALWLAAEPSAFAPQGFFELRADMIQYSGVVAIAAMSVAMILALRPRWPERWFGGLDKMYRLHKWLGIAALMAGVIHWLSGGDFGDTHFSVEGLGDSSPGSVGVPIRCAMRCGGCPKTQCWFGGCPKTHCAKTH